MSFLFDRGFCNFIWLENTVTLPVWKFMNLRKFLVRIIFHFLLILSWSILSWSISLNTPFFLSVVFSYFSSYNLGLQTFYNRYLWLSSRGWENVSKLRLSYSNTLPIFNKLYYRAFYKWSLILHVDASSELLAWISIIVFVLETVCSFIHSESLFSFSRHLFSDFHDLSYTEKNKKTNINEQGRNNHYSHGALTRFILQK